MDYSFSNMSEFMDYRKKVMSVLLPAMLMTVIATTLSSISVGSCAYATMESSYMTDIGLGVKVYRDIGLWGYAGYSDLDSAKTDTSECYEYPDSVHIDSDWEAARVTGGLAETSIAIIFCSLLLWSCCNAFTSLTMSGILSFFSFFTIIFQGCTFLFLKSDLCSSSGDFKSIFETDVDGEIKDCDLSWGGKTSIAATVFWFVSFALSTNAFRYIGTLERPVDIMVISSEPLIATDEVAAV